MAVNTLLPHLNEKKVSELDCLFLNSFFASIDFIRHLSINLYLLDLLYKLPLNFRLAVFGNQIRVTLPKIASGYRFWVLVVGNPFLVSVSATG